jgi:transposase
VVPLRNTPAVKRGDHNRAVNMASGGSLERTRSATRPSGAAPRRMPARVRLDQGRPLHPLIPRETLRWKGLYRGRASVERAFGRLKNEWGLAPLRVRRIERVRLHADLTILSQLTCVLNRSRALAFAA